ncbi:hypothetical protein AXF42_Ash010468 [Apostasia shenzhenica]|uniref:GTD-binding domain-containing protein n=1 Tax=Apostasia shenzhenica TaxID=1088818 RepID=A0A2I0BE39_9ASPA|nr:hypothetical protein AXF42_Ash010468 [Apostasia shenzhenica]
MPSKLCAMASKRENKLNTFHFCFRFVFISTSSLYLGFVATLNFSPTCLPDYSIYFFGENDPDSRLDDREEFVMDPGTPKSPAGIGRCSCGCACCGPSTETMEESGSARRDPPAQTTEDEVEMVRSDWGGDVAALREKIHYLCSELEEEQNAAATAANEAMSMILRLQREKSETEMESRQYRRLAEEQMAQDQREIAALEDLLIVYRNSLDLSSSIASDPGTISATAAIHSFRSGPADADGSASAIVKYPHIKCALSTNDDSSDLDVRLTPPYELDAAFLDGGLSPPAETEDLFQAGNLCGREDGEDESGDRVYTIDTVHRGAPILEEEGREWVGMDGSDVEDWRMRRVEMRLAELEQDNDEVRKAVASMQADVRQVVRLKVVAQQLYKILEHF